MKMLLGGIVVIACTGFAAAQINQPAGTTYTIGTATTKASCSSAAASGGQPGHTSRT